MSTINEGPRGELAAIATDLARHLRWAQSKGEKELPNPEEGAAALPPLRFEQSALPASTQPAALHTAPAADGVPAQPRPASRRIPQPAAGAGARPAGSPGRDEAGTNSTPRTLDGIRADIGDCRRCKLCESRKQIVFGDGSPAAELVFVGEGPGFEEDQRGLPFVGPAGQLLDKMIEAMGYRRDEVYIANVVKCRPPQNRGPEPDEVAACEPFLQAQLAAIRPKAIVALGKFAAQTLLQDQTPITRLRGTWREYEGIPLMPTFHPAYLLRNAAEKGKVWSDLQQVMAALGKGHRP